MPTATDLIWNLKRRYYCLQENQDIQRHDISKSAIQQRIQSYMDSQGFPALWSNEEYSFYFELIFDDDYATQQAYINKALSPERISLNVGHRALAALIELQKARVIFTTNFDEVIETAYAGVSGKSISPFHLEGSYAALDALNTENFPIYAKIHGDFKYRSIKNLSQDLQSNDAEIQKCFIAAACRYGLVVSGYSGRDSNVMSMFEAAMNQNNAFPHGLFWTVPRLSSAEKPVLELIERARDKGINANLVETGTFDIMLSRIWRQIEDKPDSIDSKVKNSGFLAVNIPIGNPAKNFPILRTNALLIIDVPTRCGCLLSCGINSYADLKAKLIDHNPDTVLAYTDKVLFWGDFNEVNKISNNKETAKQGSEAFSNEIEAFQNSTILKSFLEEALANALIEGKPHLLLRKRNGVYYVVVNHEYKNIGEFSELRNILGYKEKPGYITGTVSGVQNTHWAESTSVKLDFRDGKPWLLLRPDIWVSPMKNRESAIDFLYKRKIRRYNNKSYSLLDAWIEILFGISGGKENACIEYRPKSAAPASFTIALRTAYSGRESDNA
ncbi:SIR2 family protein [Gynuella sp.]|uniref:SIR2 family protein n=1 Tax=Gynuella sp. TaxID=2969146 RepID=UPI003D100EF3